MSPSVAWVVGLIMGLTIAFCIAYVFFTDVLLPERKDDDVPPMVLPERTVREGYVPQARRAARQVFTVGYCAGNPEAAGHVVHDAVSTYDSQIGACSVAIAYELAQAYADGVTELYGALQERSGIDPETLRVALEAAIGAAREKHFERRKGGAL